MEETIKMQVIKLIGQDDLNLEVLDIAYNYTINFAKSFLNSEEIPESCYFSIVDIIFKKYKSLVDGQIKSYKAGDISIWFDDSLSKSESELKNILRFYRKLGW